MPLTYDQDKLRDWLVAVQTRAAQSGQRRGRLSTQLLMSGGPIPGLPVTTPLTQLLNTGVLVGCDVTQRSTGADMSVDVAAGSIMYQNTPATVAAVNVAITAADATQDRIDAVVANSSGVVSVLTGAINDGSNAQIPVTTGYVLLATVYVVSQISTNYTGTIVTNAILAAESLLLIHTSPYKVSGNYFGPQGTKGAQSAMTVATYNNVMLCCPFFTAKQCPVKAIGFHLFGASGAGAVARLGIYSDDGAGARSLLIDAGTIAIDAGANTDKIIPISQILTPGQWWFAWVGQGLVTTAPTVWIVDGTGVSPVGVPSLPTSNTAGAAGNPAGGIKVAGVSGALPATISNPDYSEVKIPMLWVQAT